MQISLITKIVYKLLTIMFVFIQLTTDILMEFPTRSLFLDDQKKQTHDFCA